jgi:biopolymer transport protein ExbB
VLASILILSTVLWALIIERYWYFRIRHGRVLDRAKAEWERREEHSSWYAHRIREGLVSTVSAAARRNLAPIHTLAVVLPLIGLLGTILGLIHTFDVLAAFGTGNGRAFAEGVAQALINSTAGLVTGIAGLYFSAPLNRRFEKERQLMSDRMV